MNLGILVVALRGARREESLDTYPSLFSCAAITSRPNSGSVRHHVGIGLDRLFGDFLTVKITLVTHALSSGVAEHGNYLGVPLGPKTILVLS
ncbi:hypothetical protein GBA52_020290 [Prunus armeniaca]|nr:hypothetical protein GBA52_020290 [Prunus armeniaca]